MSRQSMYKNAKEVARWRAKDWTPHTQRHFSWKSDFYGMRVELEVDRFVVAVFDKRDIHRRIR